METKWIIITVVLVGVLAFILYLIIQNQKDKDDMVSSLNETEIEDEPKLKEEEVS